MVAAKGKSGRRAEELDPPTQGENDKRRQQRAWHPPGRPENREHGRGLQEHVGRDAGHECPLTPEPAHERQEYHRRHPHEDKHTGRR